MPSVTGPDGRKLRFPEGTDQQTVMRVLQEQYPDADWGKPAGQAKPDFSNVQARTTQSEAGYMKPAQYDGPLLSGNAPATNAPTLTQINAQNKADRIAWNRAHPSAGGGTDDGFNRQYEAAQRENQRRTIAGLPMPVRVAVGAGSVPADYLVGLSQLTGIGSKGWQDSQLANIDAARGNTAGKVGAIGGEIGMLAVPASKLAKIGGIGQFAGNVALGGVAGGSRGVREGESRLGNTAIGALAGGAGDLAGRALIGGGRTIGALVAPLTKSGQQRIAAGAIRRSATDAANLSRRGASAIPGVQRSLAEETLDPGIAQLQRQFPQELQGQALANNQARVAAIKSSFGGATRGDAAAIKAQRDAAADTILQGLPNAGFVRRIPLRDSINAAIKAHTGNPAVQADLKAVLNELPEVKTASQAYNFRKYIDHLLSKNSDKPAIKAAKRELMGIKGEIDDAISEAFPPWRTYLSDYADASRQADQANVGAAILARSRNSIDPLTGERVMTANDLAGTVNNIDQVVRGVTRFAPSNAQNTLTQGQRDLLAMLADDASRLNAANTYGLGQGSPTAQNLATQNLLNTVLGGGKLANLVSGAQSVQRLTTPLEKWVYGSMGAPEQIKATVAELLANPARARQVLAGLDNPTRQAVERWLVQTGAGAAVSAPLAAQQSTSP